jgi:hypothetical protein
MSLASRVGFLLPAFVCAAVAGCGDSYGGRLAVSGTVTLVGQPIKDGSINFFPQDGQGTETGAPIINGKFQLARKDGLRPGKYLIRVTAGDGKTPAADEGGGPGGNTNIVSVDLIPSDWAEGSQQYVEVKQGDKNEFTFAIPKTRPVGKKR